MPEEINRIVTDTLADYLFTSEPSGEENLLHEGIPGSRIFFVGNVMIDTLVRFQDRAARSPVLDDLGLTPGGYAVVTLHRPANVDDPKKLGELLQMLDCLAERIPVVFPMHPRTRQAMEAHRLHAGRVRIIPPQGYIEFLRIMSAARLMLTDSGGIQEETTILGVSCLTIRENTERPVTLSQGTNRLVGANPEAVLQAAKQALDALPATRRTPDLWDGHAATRIANTLERLL
jgi:UDP-N-acetylglucosamine 2-epimerase (non-hydrolysing)